MPAREPKRSDPHRHRGKGARFAPREGHRRPSAFVRRAEAGKFGCSPNTSLLSHHTRKADLVSEPPACEECPVGCSRISSAARCAFIPPLMSPGCMGSRIPDSRATGAAAGRRETASPSYRDRADAARAEIPCARGTTPSALGDRCSMALAVWRGSVRPPAQSGRARRGCCAHGAKARRRISCRLPITCRCLWCRSTLFRGVLRPMGCERRGFSRP